VRTSVVQVLTLEVDVRHAAILTAPHSNGQVYAKPSFPVGICIALAMVALSAMHMKGRLSQ
jgi:hypothetical protein